MIVKYYNNKEVEINFEELNDYSVVSEEPYGKILNLGTYEDIPMFGLTCSDVNVTPIKEEDKTKEVVDYIRLLYSKLKESFSSYSEHMILYYLFKRPGIHDVFNTKELSELINETKESRSKETTEPVPEESKGMDLLELPTIDEEELTATNSEKEKAEMEATKEKLTKDKNSSIKDLKYTKSLVGIEKT